MSAGPTLETERLILRPIEPQDMEPWMAFAADPEVMRYLGGAQVPAMAWRGFMTMAGAWSMTGVSMFSIVEKASGRWAGRLGPWQPRDWPGPEVGWGLARDFWGKGYAAEGAAAAIDWAFDRLGWTEVIHTIHPDNVASQTLAQRLGSTLLGPARLPAPLAAEPVEAWGQSREAWRARRR